MKELNLIPYELKEKRKRDRNKKLLLRWLFCIILFLIFITYLPKSLVSYNNKRYENLFEETKRVEKLKKQSTSILKEISNTKTYIKEIEILNKNKVSVYSEFKNISKYLKGDIKILNIDFNDEGFAINGSCENFNSINESVDKLKDSKLYKNIKLNNITEIDNGYNFSITMEKKGDIKDE